MDAQLWLTRELAKLRDKISHYQQLVDFGHITAPFRNDLIERIEDLKVVKSYLMTQLRDYDWYNSRVQ